MTRSIPVLMVSAAIIVGAAGVATAARAATPSPVPPGAVSRESMMNQYSHRMMARYPDMMRRMDRLRIGAGGGGASPTTPYSMMGG